MQMKNNHMANSQNGAVLLVSIIILVLLTILGVVGMKSSILQEKLAAGAMDQNVAFQAAESGLRDAEIYISTSVTPASGFSAACTDGLCLPSTTATSAWAAIVDWTSSGIPIVFGSKTGATAIADVGRQPRYIIELIQPDLTSCAGESATSTCGTPYRITAMGWGKRSTTPVMLQSIYVKII